MYSGSLVFARIMQHLPRDTFRRCVPRYGGDRYVKAVTCADQRRCMAFAQLTCRSGLRDIEACLRAQCGKLCHMGIRGGVSRSSPANASQARDWRIRADGTFPGLDVKDTVCAPELLGDRPLPAAVPAGAVPQDEGRRQAAHAPRPAWRRPRIRSHIRRKAA